MDPRQIVRIGYQRMLGNLWEAKTDETRATWYADKLTFQHENFRDATDPAQKLKHEDMIRDLQMMMQDEIADRYMTAYHQALITVDELVAALVAIGIRFVSGWVHAELKKTQ